MIFTLTASHSNKHLDLGGIKKPVEISVALPKCALHTCCAMSGCNFFKFSFLLRTDGQYPFIARTRRKFPSGKRVMMGQ